MSYRCDSCRVARETPDLRAVAVDVSGQKWWAPVSIDVAQAEAVMRLWRRGFCDRHAAMFGALVALTIRTESRRRAVLPGTVETRYVEVDRDPFETLTALESRTQGEALVDRVRKFVGGSALSALVELDLDRRRARVTFQLAGADDPITTVLETSRLVHTSAQEIAAALRRQQPERAR